MNLKDMTPEQRAEMLAKARASRVANQEMRRLDAALKATETLQPAKLPPPPAEEDLYDGLLSDEEKAELLAAARKRAREDKKKALKKSYAQEMLDKARREIGEMPPDEEYQKWIEEPMTIYIDMPRMRKPTGGDHDPDPIIIDQTAYTSGRHYEVPRGRAIYLLYLMDQARRHVNQVDGRSRTYYHANTGQMIYQGGPAQGGGSLGPGFDSLHRRSS
jgi:hypothetical protein